MTGESKNIGDPCPKCEAPLERRHEGFYWRGRYGDAAYCKPCNSIWQITGEEVLGWDAIGPSTVPAPEGKMDE